MSLSQNSKCVFSVDTVIVIVCLKCVRKKVKKKKKEREEEEEKKGGKKDEIDFIYRSNHVLEILKK